MTKSNQNKRINKINNFVSGQSRSLNETPLAAKNQFKSERGCV